MNTDAFEANTEWVRPRSVAEGRIAFDAQGNHAMTGTPFDPSGYDREGLDSDGFDAEGFYQRADESTSGHFMGEHRDTGTALNQDGEDQEGVYHELDEDGVCQAC